eukprot:147008-Pyramimonas_sp.AAC.1
MALRGGCDNSNALMWALRGAQEPHVPYGVMLEPSGQREGAWADPPVSRPTWWGGGGPMWRYMSADLAWSASEVSRGPPPRLRSRWGEVDRTACGGLFFVILLDPCDS